ncbi:class I tRNA ligase family protein [Candidatus Carsonella ruddii]|uniref:class I tRNA ligase family protein n=1 Tax=Carsonella ruddii TaxID=114186 RepID=UPI003D9A9889
MIKIHIFFLKKFFYIILPPPNITGEMHIGHFFQFFIIDIIIKWKILQEYKIKYIFGFDHAGISSIIKFKKINNILKQKKKLTKKFFFQLKYINFLIISKKIEFTLNKKYKKFILEKFIFFYKKGFIFLEKKIINYNEKFGIISDYEIKKNIYIKYFYYIKYKNKKNFIISTSNIISLIYNTFLCTNFKTTKKKILSPFKIKIPIYYIKKKIKNFSKNIKISPNLNNFDFLICSKKNEKIILKKKKFFFFYKIIKNFFVKKSKKIFLYNTLNKKKIFKFLIKNNFLICIKKYKSFKYLYKFNNLILKNKIFDQWFLKIKKILSFKKIIYFINIKPNKYKKIFLIWIKNMSNWCISRQIIWGTKIPFLYDKEKNIFLKKYFRYLKYYKIKEVFDTWYNSSFWILFSYFKQKKTQNIIISGFDIIFYWIIKMIINNVFFEKKILVKNVLIHGLLRDKLNKKISKSTNNVINFIHIKKNINKIKMLLLKNIFDDNQILNINYFIKKKYLLKKISTYSLICQIFIFYKFKKQIINNFNKNNYNTKNCFFLKKNFFSKKIYILFIKFIFPKKNFIKNNNWNFTINYYLNKITLNYFLLIKIKNKLFFIKKNFFLNYFEILYKIKVIFYVKYKN